jgi:uncharacterized membrane protein (UPF0127 family)
MARHTGVPSGGSPTIKAALARSSAWVLAFAAALLLWFAFAAVQAGTAPRELNLAGQILTVEIAATPETMARGLMYREHMPDDHGMLFIWPADQVVAMWMKNTLLPLSVAFIDADFRVLNIADMEPHSRQVHPSQGPARYALELNQGWFARHGVGAGSRIDDLERLLAGLAEDAD